MDVTVATGDRRFAWFSKSNPWLEGVVLGKLCGQRCHWVGGCYVLCTEDETCPHCKTSRTQVRYAANFLICGNGETPLQIVELPVTAIAKLKEVIVKHGENSVVWIGREVSGSDIKYSVKFKRELTSKEMEKIKMLQLHDLPVVMASKYSQTLKTAPEVSHG